MREAKKCRYCGHRFDSGRPAQFNLLSFLFVARQKLTPEQVIEAWGVKLETDESVALLALGHVDSRHGYLAVTDRRVLFVEHGGGHRYHIRFEQPLRSIVGWDAEARRLTLQGAGYQISVHGLRGRAAATACDLIAESR